jgi:hypothetical protein
MSGRPSTITTGRNTRIHTAASNAQTIQSAGAMASRTGR